MPNNTAEKEFTLEEKQKLFAELYVMECNFNASEAYRRMRAILYPNKEFSSDTGTIGRIASRFKNTPECLAKIDALKAELRRDYEINKEEIVSALKRMAFPAPGDKVSQKIQMDALKQLSKMGGLDIQNINIDANAEIEVVIE